MISSMNLDIVYSFRENTECAAENFEFVVLAKFKSNNIILLSDTKHLLSFAINYYKWSKLLKVLNCIYLEKKRINKKSNLLIL